MKITPTRPPYVVDVRPNVWADNPDQPWYARYRFVVLSQFANGWHVGFTSDELARSDYFWLSGVSEVRARAAFAEASA